jgi:hypothetical protein
MPYILQVGYVDSHLQAAPSPAIFLQKGVFLKYGMDGGSAAALSV